MAFVTAAFGTLAMTGVNLVAPMIMTEMTGYLTSGVDLERLRRIGLLAFALLALYLLKIPFSFSQ